MDIRIVLVSPEETVEQIRRVFEDNFHYFAIKTYIVGTH